MRRRTFPAGRSLRHTPAVCAQNRHHDPPDRGAHRHRQRLGNHPPRLVRRRDQPSKEGCNRVRPPQRALLDAIPRVLGRLGRCRAEPPLAAKFLRGDAPARLTVRVSELHRPRPRQMGACVLRLESRPPDRGQEPLRPTERLSLEPEHPRQAPLSGSCAVTSVPLPGGLITNSVPPTASARSRRPRMPEPSAGLAPPRPSSVISNFNTSPTRVISTFAFVACACFAT